MIGIRKFLVRYGRLGFVGCVGTVHAVACQRGDRVVISTDRGTELADVMVMLPVSDDREPTGELLRMESAADLSNEFERAATAAKVLKATQDIFQERNVDNVAADAEVLIDGACCVVYYVGKPSLALGPLTIDLSKMLGIRVQFQQMDSFDAPVQIAEPPIEPKQKLPAAERRKFESNFLRAGLSSWVDGDARLTADDSRILEFHGVYPQRKQSRSSGASIVDTSTSDTSTSDTSTSDASTSDTSTSDASTSDASQAANGPGFREFMLRIKCVGGRFSSGQFSALLDIALNRGMGTLRLTSRQGVQLHGVLQGDIKPILQSLEAKLLTTFGACGDVARSVMCPPLSHLPDTAARQIRSLSIELGKVFLPSAKSYFELWMDDVPVVGTVESEPIYGQTYLPHKFKIAIGLPSDNSVDLLSHDVGLLAIVEHEQLQGFNVYVGGGQAYHPDKSDTFPKLGDLLGYVEAKHIVQVAVGLAELYRDHGERSDRRTRRFKYLVQRLGIERVAIELESILGEQMLLPARQVSIEKTRTLIGWETQSNGRLSVGIPVQGGRISADLRDQLRSVLNVLKCGVCVTAQQNLILVDIDESQRELLAGLRDVIESRSASLVASTMACPALLSCRLALGDAESIAIELQQEIATQLELAGRQDSPIDVRVSGCGNGCSRPITAEIGILAVEKGVYTIRLGGCRLGNRLNMVYKSMVEKSQLSRETGDIVKRYCEEAMGDESLGDFYYRRLSDDR